MIREPNKAYYFTVLHNLLVVFNSFIYYFRELGSFEWL